VKAKRTRVSTPSPRAKRVEVPTEVRRALARLGKVASVRLFAISELNYIDAVSPGGRIQEKTLEKVKGVLSEMGKANES
jgi:hypothetical protein